MLAGLIQNTTKQTVDSLPGLMELPVLEHSSDHGIFRTIRANWW